MPDNSQNILNEEILEPINFTDPIIFHDPEIEFISLADIYSVSDGNTEVKETNNSTETITQDVAPIPTDTAREIDSTKVSGILYPLVNINDRRINYNQIISMSIFYNDFLPSISITVDDSEGIIKATNIPELNNSIKVILVPQVNNTYKSIKLEFEITGCNIIGNRILYSGTYKLNAFKKMYLEEITYAGCSGKDCTSGENKQPNTWECLHEIAKRCKLGFSSTDHCKNINDRLPRLIQRQTYTNFIQQHIKWGGIDEKNIFDCWVDLYGYIVLVNVGWLFNEENVNPKNLAIHSFVGINATSTTNVPENQTRYVNRTLTNYNNTQAANNLKIRSYNVQVNNSDLISGTSLTMYNLNLLDVNNGNNSLSRYDIEVIQNSIDGKHTEEYAKQQGLETVIECNDLPINKQKIIRNKFFSKHRQRILEVLLEEPNFGLQRGTLVNVAIFEDNPTIERLLIDRSNNVAEEGGTLESDNMLEGIEDMNQAEFIYSSSSSMPNIALSDIYYIDSMKFTYSYESNQINQYLYLIKRGPISNIDNLHTMPKINLNALK